MLCITSMFHLEQLAFVPVHSNDLGFSVQHSAIRQPKVTHSTYQATIYTRHDLYVLSTGGFSIIEGTFNMDKRFNKMWNQL